MGRMYQMDLRQFRYFSVLAEELHFRRAAERLNITQAPLSVAIQGLERELGAQLFHRTQRRVSLTEHGIAFWEHAASVLDRFDRGMIDMKERISGHAGRLRIGFTAASSLLPFFPHIISTFRNSYPGVEVTLRDLTSVGQISALQDRAIDVGFIRSQQAHASSDISYTKLLRDPLVVAMCEDNPLAALPELCIADLKDASLIFYPPRSGIGIYDQVMRACAKNGFSPHIVQEAQDASTLIGLAATGLGVAIVPSELQCIAVPHVLYRPLTDEDAITELFFACRAGEASAHVTNVRHLAQSAAAGWRALAAEKSSQRSHILA